MLPVIRSAPDGQVLDAAGNRHRLREAMRGRIVLLSFVYLQCRDACPVALGRLFAIYHATRDDSELRSNLTLVTVSFDPERDTPEALASYMAALRIADDGTRSPWEFFTTPSQTAIDPILEAYGQPVRRPPQHGASAADAAIGHLLRVYLIDRAGRVRNIYGLEFLDPRLLVADVRTLLLEERRAAP